MSKAKFEAARELIREKKYDEARAILKTTDHPQTKDWLAKLDKIDPPLPDFPVQVPTPNTLPDKFEPLRFADDEKMSWNPLAIVLIVVTVGLILYILVNAPTPPPPVPTPTLSQAQQVAVAATNDANATNIALTPTNPPPPTAAPKLGTRGNAYPVGQAAEIRDGRYQINGLMRNQDSEVEKMNMFNTDAKAGEEWVLVNATFYCDLPADKTCNMTVMQIEVVGDLGQVYEHQIFAVLDNSLTGEVFGGGTKTGLLGFIVQSKDKNLLVAVNDLGSRIFFAT